MMRKSTTILAVALCLTGLASVQAQQTVTKSNSVTAMLTVQAIDKTARLVTLRNEQGEEDTYSISPETMPRFNELKVGDKVRITYYESMVFQLLKPGAKSNSASYEAALNRAKSARPAGTLATQEKMTVTVKALDMAVPSITVTTDNGRVITRKIEDKKNLEGVKVGDKIEITYTQALVTAVESAK
jgi:Cu/Ag efflux protein CusF